MKSLWLKLLLGQLYTDDADVDTDDANDNDTCRKKHDCIGLLANEPKIPDWEELLVQNYLCNAYINTTNILQIDGSKQHEPVQCYHCFVIPA